MAETELLFETRLIGAEDVNWDNSGTNEKITFTDGNDVPHDSSLINAGHVPLPSTTRALLDNKENVAAGMEVLANRLSDITGGSSSSLSEDTTIDLDSTQTTTAIQNAVNLQPKNLGGHTLTFLFSEGFDASFSSLLVFSGFYNGFLVIDLNEDTVFDAVDLGCIFKLQDCFCKVEVKNGAISHTLSAYGVKAERCPCVYLTDLDFTGAGGGYNYAFCGIDSDGVITDCTYLNDKTKLISGVLAGLTEEHNSAAGAHSSLFASKAPLVSPEFGGTPTTPSPSANDNSQKIVPTSWIRYQFAASSVDGMMPASIEENGYAKLANGVILQWGYGVALSAGNVEVTLNLTYPHAILQAMCCPFQTSTVAFGVIADSSNIWTVSKFYVKASGSGYFRWFSIGY